MSGPEAPLKPGGQSEKGEKPWQSKHRIVCTCDRTKSPRNGTTCAPTCPSRPSPCASQTAPSQPRRHRARVLRRAREAGARRRDGLRRHPEAVLEMYKVYRPSPLCRAYNLERALNTPAKIYYKFEGNNTSGSHKLNSAIAQAYYAKAQELDKITTETGAGQWGTALAEAAAHFGVDLDVFMVKCSYEQKPHRRSIMSTFGATVTPSPPTPPPSAGRCSRKTPRPQARSAPPYPKRSSAPSTCREQGALPARQRAEPGGAAPVDHRTRKLRRA